jgi:hypothetical protein
MKKEEKTFQQLLTEVIQQARNEAAKNNRSSTVDHMKIDKSANIADEWGMNYRGQRTSARN